MASKELSPKKLPSILAQRIWHTKILKSLNQVLFLTEIDKPPSCTNKIYPIFDEMSYTQLEI